MQLIVRDKEIAQLISKATDVDSIFISVNDTKLFRIIAFIYTNTSRHDIVNSKIPKEVLDKIRTLLELGTDKFTAFELIIPYLKQDK